MTQKTHKQHLYGIVPGLSQDCPVLFRSFSRNFVSVFPLSQERDNTQIILTPTLSQNNPEKLSMQHIFLFPETQEVETHRSEEQEEDSKERGARAEVVPMETTPLYH